MSVVSQLIESGTRMPELLTPIATNDPVAAVLLAVGSLIVAICVGVLGFFGIGSLLELLNPSPS